LCCVLPDLARVAYDGGMALQSPRRDQEISSFAPGGIWG